jgi:hypothetical protein
MDPVVLGSHFPPVSFFCEPGQIVTKIRRIILELSIEEKPICMVRSCLLPIFARMRLDPVPCDLLPGGEPDIIEIGKVLDDLLQGMEPARTTDPSGV